MNIPEKPESLSEDEYQRLFAAHREKALQAALDIRKFEIELYWKRATYFWTFIAATFAGYGAVQASQMVDATKAEISSVLACVGVVFSTGWFCVNKGSKQWQENWENHVDMLEDDVNGPLYKTVMKRPPAHGWDIIKSFVTGPGPYSVSRINQIISLFVTVVWVLLLLRVVLPVSFKRHAGREYLFILGLTALTCLAIAVLGRTSEGNYHHLATKRKTYIRLPRQLTKPGDSVAGKGA